MFNKFKQVHYWRYLVVHKVITSEFSEVTSLALQQDLAARSQSNFFEICEATYWKILKDVITVDLTDVCQGTTNRPRAAPSRIGKYRWKLKGNMLLKLPMASHQTSLEGLLYTLPLYLQQAKRRRSSDYLKWVAVFYHVASVFKTKDVILHIKWTHQLTVPLFLVLGASQTSVWAQNFLGTRPSIVGLHCMHCMHLLPLSALSNTASIAQYVSFSAKLPGFGNVNGLNSRACIAPQVSNEKHGVVEEVEGSSWRL